MKKNKIVALLLGRKGSAGFPGKNIYKVLSKPLMVYPLLAALNSRYVDTVYISTDDERIMKIGKKYGAKIIVRPVELCTKQALGEHTFVHGYKYIKERVKEELEFLVLLFCNAPTVLSQQIDEGIEVLKMNPSYDSAVTVSCYNMWSPLRARKIGPDGLLYSFIPLETFGDPRILNCDRDSQGDVWFADMGVSVVRPRSLENIDEGLLPQRWMGRKIYPLKQWGGCDVDFKWQIPMVEFWLKEHGFSASD